MAEQKDSKPQRHFTNRTYVTLYSVLEEKTNPWRASVDKLKKIAMDWVSFMKKKKPGIKTVTPSQQIDDPETENPFYRNTKYSRYEDEFENFKPRIPGEEPSPDESEY